MKEPARSKLLDAAVRGLTRQGTSYALLDGAEGRLLQALDEAAQLPPAEHRSALRDLLKLVDVLRGLGAAEAAQRIVGALSLHKRTLEGLAGDDFDPLAEFSTTPVVRAAPPISAPAPAGSAKLGSFLRPGESDRRRAVKKRGR